jgi:murein DD-endopeptidase MepM/ murein hydrolase activator NlpD
MLSATFSLPVDTLATINEFENMADFRAGQELLIPSAPGLYIYNEADSSWMRHLKRRLEESGQKGMPLVLLKDGRRKEVSYYQGMNLPGDLKSRFVLPFFHSPLNKRIITSPFGYRNHPVTGQWGLHVGCDYRAPVGTEVLACADGKILSKGMVEDYGKYVIIQHRNGYTSLYGHLSRILVKKNQTIFEGMKIAETGNTGISTGPHLHFEIRQHGNAIDPENMLLKETE